MGKVAATYDSGDRIRVETRGHSFLVDQPTDAGGTDAGPTPTEIFVAGLASCVVFYAQRFLRRNDVDPTGLEVDCDYELATDRPARVSALHLRVTLPDGIPDRIRTALPKVIDHCTVHETLRNAPTVRITFDEETAAA